jgi:hypothetical protein
MRIQSDLGRSVLLSELIVRCLAEDKPAVVEDGPIICSDRDEALWQPIDPQVQKALAHVRERMKFYGRELRRKRR